MWKSRLLWALWLLGALALYLFENGLATRFLLAASALLPPVFVLLSALAARRVRAQLELPARGQRGGACSCELRVNNKSPMPLQRVRCRLLCENVLTGERSQGDLTCAPAARRAATVRFELTAAHCGQLRVALSGLWVSDPFGLAEIPVGCAAGGSVWILPGLFRPQVALTGQAFSSLMLDADAMAAPGHDPSEPYAIREYIPGDDVRSIHWKLSAKTDRLMVRERGLPLGDQALLLFETALHRGFASPAAIDAMAAVLLSLSRALAEEGVRHSVLFQPPDAAPQCLQIEDVQDAQALIPHILSCPVRAGEATLAGCLRAYPEKCAAAHVAAVSALIPPDMPPLPGALTVLCPSGEAADGETAERLPVRRFDPHAYERDLRDLNL